MRYSVYRIKYLSLYAVQCMPYKVFVTIRGIVYAVYWVKYGVFVTIPRIVYEVGILVRMLFTWYTIQYTSYTTFRGPIRRFIRRLVYSVHYILVFTAQYIMYKVFVIVRNIMFDVDRQIPYTYYIVSRIVRNIVYLLLMCIHYTYIRYTLCSVYRIMYTISHDQYICFSRFEFRKKFKYFR